VSKHEELPQWHPGAQIRKGHPEDAAVQVDRKKTEEWERQRRLREEVSQK